MELALNKIRLDGNTQSRPFMHKDKIIEYAELMMEGKKFPPLLVYSDGVYYWLGDGFHRYQAYKNIKQDVVDVEIVEGTRRDAFTFSLGANSDHGMSRTRDEKRNAVLRALKDEEYAKFSDRAIAELCKLSHTFVANVRKEYKASLNAKPIEEIEEDIPKVDEPEVKKLVPSSEYETNYEDELADLASHTNELAKELEQVKTELAIVQMDDLTEAQQEVKDTIESLRARVEELEAEVKGLKNSRNHLQVENSELKKTLAYWKRQADKK